jgi:hypothetical protein
VINKLLIRNQLRDRIECDQIATEHAPSKLPSPWPHSRFPRSAVPAGPRRKAAGAGFRITKANKALALPWAVSVEFAGVREGSDACILWGQPFEKGLAEFVGRRTN